ncbi:RagB/SusD family nutrient uptake outer membrane protein [Algoriphagus sp. D3-2-R+10]|uniref:RagB/SusD family nutrient uptake outer membrane protein n=1 Tax=Algoriphagus aurantiacus TaxID=3103948 RepID=UPI002B395C2B|nr:RagB/SusD family nutrient uptake outer membrane protein [Algoriphagus sp. D3-2-R+10]MEB2778719.1 RagB/SusD family nutrient uptake outer membrane protein [Algoriphagus sp. D3-2-R+10]
MDKFVNYIIVLLFLTSCSGFLDEKPSVDIVVPTTLQDLQALLDNSSMNSSSGISVIGTDDLITTQEGLMSLNNQITEGNAYLWKEDILEGLSFSDWNLNYSNILTSNIVLQQLDGVSKSIQNEMEWNRIKGSALFYRAFNYYDLLRLFAPQYDPATAGTQLGVPLRLDPEIRNNEKRADLETCYAQIRMDLENSLELLPDLPIDYPTRTSKWAAYGLLARMSLQLGRYEEALKYADLCLGIKSDLIDYNSLNPAGRFPFSQFNEEVIFHSSMVTYSYISRPLIHVNPELLSLFTDFDLRKALYLRPTNVEDRFNFKGHYTSGNIGFSGIAVDEIFLIRAEALVRRGQFQEGMDMLNDLLVTRFSEGNFEPLTAVIEEVALELVLEERRKTLVFRGHRWDDLRRLNRDSQFQKTLSREVGGVTYTLLPNSKRYVYPIPQNELDFNDILQNDRN